MHFHLNSGLTYTDDWSFPTSLSGWNRQRSSNIHVTTNRSLFSTILSSWFTILWFLSNFLGLNFMNWTLRRCFNFFWLLSVLITRTAGGMLKDKIDMLAFYVAPRPYNRISQGSYQNQVMDPGCQ